MEPSIERIVQTLQTETGRYYIVFHELCQVKLTFTIYKMMKSMFVKDNLTAWYVLN